MPLLTEDQEILRDPTLNQYGEKGDTDLGPSNQIEDKEKAKRLEEDREDYINSILLDLVKEAEREDETLRYSLLLKCKRNNLYFNNIQKIFYDDVAHDYKTFDSLMKELQAMAPNASDIKTVNIYRAFVESIVAALSVSVPNVQFLPDDAEDPEDIETAAAYSKISELIQKHTHAPLMLIKGLVILWNQGVLAAHNHYKTDLAFGSFKTPKTIKQKEVPKVNYFCSFCSYPLPEVDPNIPVQCPACKETGLPQGRTSIVYEDEVTEFEYTPKGQSEYEFFGPTQVKLPLFARNQAGCGYLVLRIEDHIAKWKTVYSDYADEITDGSGDTERYERWSRLGPEHQEEVSKYITTGRFCWMRPWWFNHPILDEEDSELLLEMYPDGVRVGVIGECVVEKIPEKLDDCWTITIDPKADYIHAEAPGNSIIPLQDAKNDVFNLGLQSIEYGIPETFANPKTLNLKKYGKTPAAVGMITAALPPAPDKGLADGFHTIKTATLSSEYMNFDKGVDSLGQFVSGAMPQIWGGGNVGSGETAAQYTSSRSQALQRLQIVWQMISIFWSELMFKCTREYAKNLRYDEKFSKRANGTFVNVWINKTSLKGQVGHVEPDAHGQIPQSWAQKKDFFMSLVTLKDPMIGLVLSSPNNAEMIKQITGIPDLYIPGEHDRNKQYSEYYLLSVQEPQGELPSIPIDVDVDDHLVHMQVLKNILVSPVGIQLYNTNPASYQNCIFHYRQHELALQAKTMAPAGISPEGQPPDSMAKGEAG